MLENSSSGVRFSREYAVLLMRSLPKYCADISPPDNIDCLDLDKLNSHVRALIKTAKDTSYGLEVGRRLHICDYGAVGYAAMNRPTLIEALHTTVQFRNLIVRGLNTAISEDDQGFHYMIQSAGEDTTLWPLVEYELAAALRFAELTTCSRNPHPMTIKRVLLEHAPIASLNSYTRVFGCTPTFNASRNALIIDTKSMRQATQNPNETIYRLLSEKLTLELSKHRACLPFAERVKAYLAAAMPEFYPSQEDAALHFCLSVSGLKTRLRKEGASFRTLYDEARFRVAEQVLRDESKSLKQISYDLGFSDQSAFNRAFKRWSGCSPLDYRKAEII